VVDDTHDPDLSGTDQPPDGGWPNNTPPNWADAVDAFMLEAFKPGDIVPHSWFFDSLGIEQPLPSMLAQRSDALRLKFVTAFGRFRDHLLVTHNVALRSRIGVGYEVVPPAQQAHIAKRVLDDDIASSFRKALMWSTYVDTSGMTQQERNERVHIQANIASLQAHLAAARAAAKRRNRSGDPDA